MRTDPGNVCQICSLYSFNRFRVIAFNVPPVWLTGSLSYRQTHNPMKQYLHQFTSFTWRTWYKCILDFKGCMWHSKKVSALFATNTAMAARREKVRAYRVCTQPVFLTDKPNSMEKYFVSREAIFIKHCLEYSYNNSAINGMELQLNLYKFGMILNLAYITHWKSSFSKNERKPRNGSDMPDIIPDVNNMTVQHHVVALVYVPSSDRCNCAVSEIV